METQKKDKTVGIYFSAEQIKNISETARALGMTMASFCRVASLRVMKEEKLKEANSS